jgi:hypothetical protein
MLNPLLKASAHFFIQKSQLKRAHTEMHDEYVENIPKDIVSKIKCII